MTREGGHEGGRGGGWGPSGAQESRALAGLAPGSQVAGYVLAQQIGAGGMAVVYRVRAGMGGQPTGPVPGHGAAAATPGQPGGQSARSAVSPPFSYQQPAPQQPGYQQPPPAPRRRTGLIAAAAAGVAAVAIAVVAVILTSSPGHTANGAGTHGGGHRGAGSSPATSPPPSTPPAATDFTVCTDPVGICKGQMKTEPRQILTSGDGSGFVKAITWTGWGTATATGKGTMEVDNCQPNCAQGTFTGYPATVTLTGLTRYGGKQGYATMTVAAPTSPAGTSTYRHLLPR